MLCIFFCFLIRGCSFILEEFFGVEKKKNMEVEGNYDLY